MDFAKVLRSHFVNFFWAVFFIYLLANVCEPKFIYHGNRWPVRCTGCVPKYFNAWLVDYPTPHPFECFSCITLVMKLRLNAKSNFNHSIIVWLPVKANASNDFVSFFENYPPHEPFVKTRV